MQTRGLADTVWAKEIDQRHEAWAQDLPKTPDGLWAFLTKLDEGRRQSLFAHCVSLTLNAVIEPWSKGTGAIAHAKQIARSIGFDMVDAGWKPTVDSYLGRVTKAHILQAVREAKGEQSAQLIQRLKKADMACEAERLLDGSGWLPEVLRLAGSEAATAKSQAVIDHADHENDDMITNSVLSEWAAFLPDAEINDRADDLGDVCHQDYLDAAG